MKYRSLLTLFLALPFLLHARKVPLPPEGKNEPTPWFTGTLLTPSAHVIPFGHQNYEPYFYWTTVSGFYDNHWHSHSRPRFKDFLFQPLLQFGILPATEFDISPQFLYNNTRGQHEWRVSDIPMSLSFQLLKESPTHPYPTIKLRLGLNAPLGKYDRLDPARFGTDVGGTGNWDPSIGLLFSYLFHLKGIHFLAWHNWFNYTLTVPVHVHGLSFYGGAPRVGPIKGTRGTVYPGNIFLITEGFEFSLTQNWVLSLDLVYQHVNRNRFSGHTLPGTAPVAPSSELFSIAPALEYNFSPDIGIIAGPWFSVAGRNRNLSAYFISWIFAINIYH